MGLKNKNSAMKTASFFTLQMYLQQGIKESKTILFFIQSKKLLYLCNALKDDYSVL